MESNLPPQYPDPNRNDDEDPPLIPPVPLNPPHPPKPPAPLNSAAPPSMPPSPLNPEDLTAFALPSVFQESVAKKVFTTIPIRKPGKEAFVRTHPDPEYWMPFGLIELKEAGKIYLLTPEIATTLRDEGEPTLVTANLVLTVDRRQNPSL